MIDNRKVNENHQKGISNKTQRKGEPGRVGQPGKMGGKIDKAHWNRSGAKLTPRKA